MRSNILNQTDDSKANLFIFFIKASVLSLRTLMHEFTRFKKRSSIKAVKQQNSFSAP